ncbi:MAG TPA: hypothetical protein VK524_30835, partial [Polyangiaceae bacterium]|nr:hypothetical protein [Polyangiaceae bacterium]
MSLVRCTWRRWTALVLMLASGFAGLGYQIIWTQQTSLWLGHEAAAVLAVVAAFFGGLAVGGLILGSRIEHSARPMRWYAGCELVIALWSVVLLFVWSPFSAWMHRATGVEPSPVWHWSLAFCGTVLLFLPATAAMGATLPAMERLSARMYGERSSLAALYAGNTLGALLGVLAAAFWLIAAVGLARSAALCIALNLICAVTAWAVFRRTEQSASSQSRRAVPAAQHADRARAGGVVWRLAFTGFLGIGYEVVVVRVLSQVTENTFYTFATLLAAYLIGSAAGAAAYQRWLAGRSAVDGLSDRLLALLAAACLAGTLSLWAAQSVKSWALDAFGAGVEAAIAAEGLLALLAFGPATLVMGALFNHLCRAASAAGVSVGHALGINLVGAALAPAVCGVLAVFLIGPKFVLLAIVLGYLIVTSRQAWFTRRVWVLGSAALAVALFAPPLSFIDVPEGGRVVSYEDGVTASVSVVEDASGVARLHINNRVQEGSSATPFVDAR